MNQTDTTHHTPKIRRMTGRTLTPAMRAALQQARNQPLRRTHTPGPGRPPWPAHPSTIAALIRHALTEHTRGRNRHGHAVDLWTITQLGIEALEPATITRRRRPLYIAEGWPDYTSDNSRKMRGEPEAVDPAELAAAWFGAAAERHAQNADRRQRARTLSHNTRAA